jgi:hypothetical protein
MSWTLADLNDTELAAIVQDSEPEASRTMPRLELVKLLDNDHPTRPTRPINKLRLNIMGYIIDHWSQVEVLLSCPAKSKDPRACFSCTDIQVIECGITNKALLTQHQQNKKETT